MKLYAISDLHLSNKVNRQALETLPTHSEDWLILGGDIGETEDHLRFALAVLTRRFQKLLWAPGNHDLWTLPSNSEDWRTRFRAVAVVYGHLHIRGTRLRDGVRFEEVSLGCYPWNWNGQNGIQRYLREILPGPGA